jgi:hypothetical protein
MRIAAAAGDASRVAGRHSSGPGTSGGAGARCTGSSRATSPKVPTSRTRSTGPASPSCTTLTWAVETLRPARSTSADTSTGPATAADRKCALHDSGAVCPDAVSPSAAAPSPNAMSTPPLIACPMSHSSPRWPRAVASPPTEVGGAASHSSASTSSSSATSHTPSHVVAVVRVCADPMVTP